MIGTVALYRSSIGKKVVMAVTGLILFGYVFVHMLGNLKIYQGADKVNAYGVFLREVGDPFFAPEQALWIVRIVLLLSVVLHIVAAVQLTQMDWASRPVGYAASRKDVVASYASRTMRWGGLILALFIVYHILHLTTGTAHPSYVHGDVYGNMVNGFRVWYVSAFYVAAMVALGLHLYHGIWSTIQTLGWRHARNDDFWRNVALVFAVLITVGNVSIPLAVLTGMVG